MLFAFRFCQMEREYEESQNLTDRENEILGKKFIYL